MNDTWLILFGPAEIKMKMLTRMLMWKMKQKPRERRRRRRKNTVSGYNQEIICKVPLRSRYNIWWWLSWFLISHFQLSKKRVKLRQKYHSNRHLTIASCWECTSTEQIAWRTTCWSHTPWWRSMLWMKSLDSMWRKRTGENRHYQTLTS